MIVSEQLRAARAMARWSQEELSRRSGVPIQTLKRLEGFDGPLKGRMETILKLTEALEQIVSFDDNQRFPGVRLK